MSILVKCADCNKPYNMQNGYFRKNCQKFQVSTLIEFNKVYVCRYCRGLYKTIERNSSLQETCEFRKLRHLLQEEVNVATRRGINNPVVRENFLQSVKALLDSRNIKQYTFDIRRGELNGIILQQLPLFGNVLIKLDSKGK